MNLIDQHPDWIIYEVVSGSQAYGLATPESDVDLRGVFIPSKEYFLSPFKYVEQCESKNPDRTLFEIRKFVKLATDNNPNILELLFIDEQHIQKITKEGEQLRSIRNEFLSAKCKFTYSGYAMSQLKRIKTHKKWLIHPRETQPKREEFGLFYKIFTEEEFGYLKALMEMDNTKGNPIVMSSQFPSGVIELFNKEREYRNALADYNSYQTWKKQRNPKRAELEAKYGYDCYTEDTEFLTNNGWKLYDDVKNSDGLATINKDTGELYYQNIVNRVKYKIDDKIINCSTKYSYFNVTRNHKLLVSRMHRQKSNNFSRKYKNGNWELVSYDDLKKKRYSAYYIRNAINNNQPDNQSFSDDYLRLIGAFVSEGCFLKYKTKNGYKIKGISISQLEGGRICKIIEGMNEFNFKKYSFVRKGRTELTYNLYNTKIAQKIFELCGDRSYEKHLPDWIKYLSVRQIGLLFDTMMAGDGTNKKFSEVYYTSSKQLADDTQLLCFYAGWISKVWKHKNMYQVYVKRNCQKVNSFFIKGKVSNCKEVFYKGNVVCFEVPNSILVTRLKGEVAIQGNTKHAKHLVRLMLQGEEILLQGTLTVDVSNRPEVIEVGNGLWGFDQLLDWASAQDNKLEEIYQKQTYVVPHHINVQKIEAVVMEMITARLRIEIMDDWGTLFSPPLS